MNGDTTLWKRLCDLIVVAARFVYRSSHMLWGYWCGMSGAGKLIAIVVIAVMASVFLVYDIVTIGIAIKTFFLVTVKKFVLLNLSKIPMWIVKAFGNKILKYVLIGISLGFLTDEIVKRWADKEVEWMNWLKKHFVDTPIRWWDCIHQQLKMGFVATLFVSVWFFWAEFFAYFLIFLDLLIRVGIYLIGWALRTFASGPIGANFLGFFYWLGQFPYKFIFRHFAFARRWHANTEKWRNQYIEEPKAKRLAVLEERRQSFLDKMEADEVGDDMKHPDDTKATRKHLLWWSAGVAAIIGLLHKFK